MAHHHHQQQQQQAPPPPPPAADALAGVRRALRGAGVDAMEPAVGRALLDFCYRYTADVLLAAEHFAAAAGRPAGEVGDPDVTLALQAQAASGAFAAPAPAADVAPLAAALNSVPLPAAPRRFGLRLPPEGECLTQPNWQIDADALGGGQQQQQQQQQQLQQRQQQHQQRPPLPPRPRPPAGAPPAKGGGAALQGGEEDEEWDDAGAAEGRAKMEEM